MNLYAYVGNDPVNGTDPSGEQNKTTGCCLEFIEEQKKRDEKRENREVQYGPNLASAHKSVTAAQAVGAIGTAEIQAVAVAATLASPVDEVAATGFIASKIPGASGVLRGLSSAKGKFTKTINEAGGKLYTSIGEISQNTFKPIVERSVAKGEKVDILSGVHGRPDGSRKAAKQFYNHDVHAFGDLPGVNVHNIERMTLQEINAMVTESQHTVIAAFCHSAKCL